MAFCNSCGATLDAGTKFCNKCGAAVPAASVPAASAPVATTPAQGGSNVLKIVLIVVAVLVGLGIIGSVTTAYFVHRAYVKVRDQAHIEEKDGKVKVETPFGTVETSQDSSKVASDLGDFMYPDAEAVKDASSIATFGDTHTVSTQLETSDAPDKVATYYKAKMPNATYTSSQGNVYSIMAGDKDRKSWTTISISPQGDKTVIQISRVSRS
jgi:uncharacterized membrane protein YvbJ